jgi:hypothetical protein
MNTDDVEKKTATDMTAIRDAAEKSIEVLFSGRAGYVMLPFDSVHSVTVVPSECPERIKRSKNLNRFHYSKPNRHFQH